MTKNLFKYLKKFLPLIGIVILIYIIYSLNFEDIKNAFLSINPIYLLLGLTLRIPWILVRTYSWRLILKEHKIHLGFFRSVKIFLIGFFYCSITPGYIGHLMRAPYVKEETGEPYGKLFVNVLIDSTLRSIASFIMIIVGAFLVISLFPELFWINIVIFAILGLVLFFFIKKERGEKFFHTLIKYFIPKKFKSDLTRFVDTFYKDFPKVTQLIPPLLLGFVTWSITFTQIYIIVWALGLDIPYLYFILLFPLANMVGTLPISFAGLGLREGTSILIFTTLFAGVTSEEVLVFTLLGFLLTDTFTGLVGFLVSLTETREKKCLPKN